MKKLSVDVHIAPNFEFFRFLKGNRMNIVPAFEKKVNKLVRSFEKGYRQINPIQITPDRCIVEGNTRLEALYRMWVINNGNPKEQHKWRPRYVVVPPCSVEEIREMNAYNGKWDSDDSASSRLQYGEDQYQTFLDFRKEFDIPQYETTLLFMGNPSANASYSQTAEIVKNGNLPFPDLDKITKQAQELVSLRHIVPNVAKDRLFIRAFMKAQAHPDFKIDRFVHKIGLQGGLKKQRSINDYLSHIQYVYNFSAKKTENDRIMLVKL